MGRSEVEAYLSWLASERQVAASTHKQALSALVFLYTRVLGVQLPWLAEIGRPRVQRRLPVVLSRDELAAVFLGLDGEQMLFAELLYGTGLRLTEGLQLRVKDCVKDIDFQSSAIIVRAGKGGKDRVLMLPTSLVPALRDQLARSHALWATDQAAGRGGVEMPYALDRKYPRAGASWPWFWVFPQAALSTDPNRPAQRRDPPAPPVRPDFPARLQARGRTRWRDQAGHPALTAPCLRHPSAAVRLRHSNGAGIARACRRGHHDDLHPCAQIGRRRRSQPCRRDAPPMKRQRRCFAAVSSPFRRRFAAAGQAGCSTWIARLAVRSLTLAP